MGRPTLERSFIHFKYREYISDLKKAIRKVAKEIGEEIVKEMKKKLSEIPFKDNPVKIKKGVGFTDNRKSGEYTTSDLSRKTSLIRSVAYKNLKWVNDNLLTMTISAMEKDFKNSHIGIYYEFGTGQYAEEAPNLQQLGTPNNYRSGKEIVSRSRHVDYIGQGKGVWTDAGGNLRVTGSREAGRRTEGFIKYIGDDVKAYHWFRNSITEKKDDVFLKYKEAIRNVKFSNYLVMKNKFTLGKN